MLDPKADWSYNLKIPMQHLNNIDSTDGYRNYCKNGLKDRLIRYQLLKKIKNYLIVI